MDEQTPTPQPTSDAPTANLRQTSTLAIVSLVAGILGWSLLPWVGSLVAIITGHMARSEIRQNPDTREGDGMAVAGLVLGWASFIIGLLVIVAFVLFFGGILALIAGLGLSGQLH